MICSVCVCVHACVYSPICVCVCVCARAVCRCKYIIHSSVCALLLLVIATPRRSLWHFPTFCTSSSWLSILYVVLCLCCIHHSPSQINYSGQIINYTWFPGHRHLWGRQRWSIRCNHGWVYYFRKTRWVNKRLFLFLPCTNEKTQTFHENATNYCFLFGSQGLI